MTSIALQGIVYDGDIILLLFFIYFLFILYILLCIKDTSSFKFLHTQKSHNIMQKNVRKRGASKHKVRQNWEYTKKMERSWKTAFSCENINKPNTRETVNVMQIK